MQATALGRTAQLLLLALVVPLSTRALVSDVPMVHQVYEPVSMIALIANPEAYEGRAVSVVGVMVIEFEGDRLCLTYEHADVGSWDSCLELAFEGLNNVVDRHQKDWRVLAEWSRTYVRAEGTFHKKVSHVSPYKLYGVTRVATRPDEQREWKSDRE